MLVKLQFEITSSLSIHPFTSPFEKLSPLCSYNSGQMCPISLNTGKNVSVFEFITKKFRVLDSNCLPI